MAKSKDKYYRLKAKNDLITQGYDVAVSEIMYKVKGFYKKWDIFSADLIAMNRVRLKFINVKYYNKTKGYRRVAITDGKKKFTQHQFPPFVDLELWLYTDHKPVEIIRCNDDQKRCFVCQGIVAK